MSAFQPARLGKYLLLDRIAVGGMAELYRAKIIGVQGFEKLIAIKKILPHLATEAELVTSFIDEAKLAALLQHQSIVQIYDFGKVDDSYFIAMEYLLGKDLRLIVGKAKEINLPLSLENALFITSRICAGLDYAHKLNDFQGNPLRIIHRDISPQNILVTYQGDIKIVDFGIARAATQSTLTQVGMIKGKVAYMSPEQARGDSIDSRSDIFSVGIVLYELATGRRMFQGETLRILAQVREAEFEPAENVAGHLPPKLFGILRKALEKDPAERYQSCGEMQADLEDCIYQLCNRPLTSRGLSEYMNRLFTEEIASEEKAMREVLQIHAVEEQVAEPRPERKAPSRPEPEPERPISPRLDQKAPQLTRKPESVKTAVPASEPKQKRHGIMYGAFAAVLGALILVFTLMTKEQPAPPVAKEKPESVPQEEKTSEAELPPAVKAAIAALKKDRFSEAVELFEKAFAKEPGLKHKMGRPYSQALQGLALDLADKDRQKARALLLKAVEYDPASVQGHFQLGLLYVRFEDYGKAIEVYEKVTKLDPRFPDAFFNLGYAYAVTKKYEKAEKMYGRVVELKPSYVDEALFNLAMVQEKLGKKAQCLSSLERAVKVNPGNRDAQKRLQMLRAK